MSLPALASSVERAACLRRCDADVGEAGQPEAGQRLVIVLLSWLSIDTMPVSPKSWPFCRSAVVVAVGTRFSVDSERVEVTTALYASTSAWTFLVIASVSIAGCVVLTDDRARADALERQAHARDRVLDHVGLAAAWSGHAVDEDVGVEAGVALRSRDSRSRGQAIAGRVDVKSAAAPVLREEKTRRSTPPSLTTAA